jgi:hypothetical protein
MSLVCKIDGFVVEVLDVKLYQEFAVLQALWVQLHCRGEIELHKFPFVPKLVRWQVSDEK